MDNKRNFFIRHLAAFRDRFMRLIYDTTQPPGWLARASFVGILIAFTPTFGLHTPILWLIWLCCNLLRPVRFNLPLAFAVTWVINHATVLPYYFLAYLTGASLMRAFSGGTENLTYAAFKTLLEPLYRSGMSESLGALKNIFIFIGKPLLVGCIPYCLIFSIVAYVITFRIAVHARQNRETREDADMGTA